VDVPWGGVAQLGIAKLGIGGTSTDRGIAEGHREPGHQLIPKSDECQKLGEVS